MPLSVHKSPRIPYRPALLTPLHPHPRRRYAGTPLAQLLASTYAACQALSPRLEAAIARGDVAAVAAARDALSDMQEGVEAALRAAQPKVNAKTRRWLQVGAGGVGGMRHRMATISQSPTTPCS